MSLYESLQEQLNGREYTGYFAALCPFPHDGGMYEHNPSLMVYEDGSFRCKSCHRHGTLEYLAQSIGRGGMVKVTRSQSIVLPRWRKWAETYGDLLGIARAAHRGMKQYPGHDFYFKKRKLEAFIDKGYFGYLDGWCTFPVFDPQHRVIDIVVRSAKSKDGTRYVIRPDKGRVVAPLYCPDWQRVKDESTVYVVYGMIDAWAMYAAGLASITGTTGKSLSADQLKPLGKRYIIVPDLYEEREAYLLAGELGWRAEVKRLKYDLGCKDPDDEVRINGIDRFKVLLQGA